MADHNDGLPAISPGLTPHVYWGRVHISAAAVLPFAIYFLIYTAWTTFAALSIRSQYFDGSAKVLEHSHISTPLPSHSPEIYEGCSENLGALSECKRVEYDEIRPVCSLQEKEDGKKKVDEGFVPEIVLTLLDMDGLRTTIIPPTDRGLSESTESKMELWETLRTLPSNLWSLVRRMRWWAWVWVAYTLFYWIYL